MNNIPDSQRSSAFLNGLVYELYGIAQGQPPSLLRGAPVVSKPDLVSQVVMSPEVYIKDFSLLTLFGRSRFDSNGADWKARRDLTQPHYLRAAVPAKVGRIEDIFAAAMADPASMAPARLQRTLFGGSLKIFFEALGCDVDTGPFLPIVDRIRETFKTLQFLAWSGGADREVEDAQKTAAEVLNDFRSACLAEPSIAALLDRLGEEGPPDFDPVAELAINMFAGVETTTASISWAIDRLGCNADVQNRIYLESLMAGEPVFLDALINETLRFFPPIPFLSRRVASPATLGGVALEGGELLLVSIVGLHQNSGSWTDAATFQSARHEFVSGTYDRRAFAPFLAGPRVCGGMKLARLEIRAALSAFVRRYRVERDGDEVRIDYALAMRPASWDSIRVVARA